MGIKPEIKYGFIGAIGLIIWTLVQYFGAFHTTRLYWGQYTGYAIHLILLYTLWNGLREKFEDQAKDFSLRKGIRESILQLMITAIPASLFMFVYDYKINPFWVDQMISFQRNNGYSTGFFLRFANDPEAQAIILSNTETHLCLYFLTILVSGSSMAFMITSYLLSKKY